MSTTYALAGWPLGFSLSPAMHEASFAALGIDAAYVLRPAQTDDLPAVIDDLRSGRLAGANVTVPHKVAIRRWLDDESDLVTAIGSANTIVRTEFGLRGDNTDGVGFRHVLETIGMLSGGGGRRAIVLGAGGSARAVVHTLLRARFDVRLLARSAAQSGTVAAQLYRAQPGAMIATGLLTPANVVAEAAGADLLVNTTPVGAGAPNREAAARAGRMDWTGRAEPADSIPVPSPAASLWPLATPFPARLTVVDIVAWPLETPLMHHARASGARAVGGLEMLVAQAERSFKLWTGVEPPPGVMRAAALAAAEARAG